MDKSLLDTDMLSEILRQQDQTAVANGLLYLREHSRFAFSAFTRFEVRRGYLEKRAIKQLEKFEEFCQHSEVLPVTDSVINQACELWALARQGGHPCGDADLIIAATALTFDLRLVTGNTRHFAWVPGLTVSDWRL
jgi:tRNA(fMet)-specific endonuclease VapC